MRIIRLIRFWIGIIGERVQVWLKSIDYSRTYVMIKILTGKPTGKRSLGRPRRRLEDNIRMNLEEIGINAGNWVDSTQDRDH